MEKQRVCIFILLVILQFLVCGWSLDAKNFVGRRCTLSGNRNYGGVCKLIQECPEAISNLRAGVLPTICVHVGRVAVVCCQSERRISLQKYEEYSQSLHGNTKEKATPLLPIGYQGTGNEPKGGKVTKDGYPLLFVVGGKEAGAHDYPHAVALGYETGRNGGVTWRCSGTLISDEFVLSAAHCLQAKRGKLVKILLGDTNLEDKKDAKTRMVVDVDKEINHPKYDSALKYNDIGLIKLKGKVKLSDSIMPACLPQPADRLELYPEQLIAHGWGLTEFAGSPSETLQFVKLTRFTQVECNKEYADQPDRNYTFPRGIESTQICAGERGEEAKDTCEGDSGSGLMIKKQKMDLKTFYVIGITSFGSKYCGYGPPGIYTNVQSFLDWIEDTVWPS